MKKEVRPSRQQVIDNIEYLESLKVEDFDEIPQIKNYFPQKRAGKYPEMAESLPHGELMKIEKSYAKFVKKLKDLIGS